MIIGSRYLFHDCYLLLASINHSSISIHDDDNDNAEDDNDDTLLSLINSNCSSKNWIPAWNVELWTAKSVDNDDNNDNNDDDDDDDDDDDTCNNLRVDVSHQIIIDCSVNII